MKPTFYCSLLYVISINMCLINGCLSSASAVIHSWFIYKLQKCTRIAFSRNSLYAFYSRNPTCEIPPSLQISNCKYPHSFGIPVQRTPLSFRNPKSHLGYRYGYSLESPNLACLLCQFSSVNNPLDIPSPPPELCSALSFVNGTHGK